eukprot:7256715-Alexandrium_andersonii.AAC.1
MCIRDSPRRHTEPQFRDQQRLWVVAELMVGLEWRQLAPTQPRPMGQVPAGGCRPWRRFGRT